MQSLAFVLALPLLAAQEESAEQVFKKIEEAIKGAKTLSVKLEGYVSAHASVRRSGLRRYGPNTVHATLLLKEGDKARLSIRKPFRWEDERLVPFYSDGTKAKCDPDEGAWDAPKGINTFFRIAITRAGLSHLRTMMSRILSDEDLKKLPDPNTFLKVSDVKYGDDDGQAKTLTYKLKSGKGDEPILVRLWYDPKTYGLLKRTLKGQGRDRSWIIETYKSFDMNGDIPDEKFTLPPEDPRRNEM